MWETSRNKLKKYSITKNCSDLSLFDLVISFFLKNLVKMWLNDSLNAPSERTSSFFARGSRLTWCKLIQSETQFALSFLYWSTICPKYSVVKSHFRLKAQTNKVRFICSILINLKSDPELKGQRNSFLDAMKFGRLFR